MPNQVPHFDNQTIAKIVLELYGVEGEISPLVAFEDQNALIKTSNDRFVFKIANKRWPIEFLQMQHDVMEHLSRAAPDLKFSRAIETKDGKTITIIDGFAVRMLTFLKGDMLTNTPRSPDLYHDVGRFLGQYSSAMKTYNNPAADRPDDLWNLDNVIACKDYLCDVIDEDARERITRLFVVYEKDILPKVAKFRKAVIHGDANEQNFLINPDQPTKISGLIDFGEMIYGSQVNDLAICLAYSLLGEDDIEMASQKIIAGYCQEFTLEESELEIIYDLAAMRLVTNITMTSHDAKKFPDNQYILISQKFARDLLKKLEQKKYILK